MRILLVEDEITLNRNISQALSAENFKVESVFDGELAERYLKKERFDCVILDINLPKKNGFDLCKEFRNFNKHTPIIMLTAFDELDDKIKGFDCGADDYLTKPFYMKELILRVKSLIKRSQNIDHPSQEFIHADDIVINLSTMKVTRQNQEIILTPREFQILLKLCKNWGEIVSKQDLIKEIWGTSLEVNTNTIEVYVNFLRNKVDKPFQKNSIKTKIGYGYYFEAE